MQKTILITMCVLWAASQPVRAQAVNPAAKGFTIQFEKGVPANAKIDWMIVR